MQFATIQHQSLIDYPGKISCVLFTAGCNFRCWYCHNFWLVLPHKTRKMVDEANALCFLEERIGWLDGVVVSGGEPTIHQNLPDFLLKVKALGYPVKLDTNGSNPVMVEHLLKNSLVDFIALDVKAIPAPGFYSKIIGMPDTEMVKNVNETISIILKSGINFQFRITWLPDYHSKRDIDIIRNRFLRGSELVINTLRTQNGILANYI